MRCEYNANLQIANMPGNDKPIYAELSYKITGILFTVHNELGKYRNEQQYADAVENYLKRYGIHYEREKIIPGSFVGELSGRNKIDFLIENKIILELKAKRVLSKEDYYQTKRYLAAFKKKLALLVNFRDSYLKSKRILNAAVDE